jgi:hypothetical protein
MLDTSIHATTETTVRKTNRGFQIWIEGQKLSNAGFTIGSRYDLEMSKGQIVITSNPNGKKKVSKGIKNGIYRPIIDLHNKKIGQFFTPESRVIASFSNSIITIREI